MIFKMEIFYIVLEQFSVKVKNKIAKMGINFIILNFYLFFKTKTKVNQFLLKLFKIEILVFLLIKYFLGGVKKFKMLNFEFVKNVKL